jgi:hypothetical protein
LVSFKDDYACFALAACAIRARRRHRLHPPTVAVRPASGSRAARRRCPRRYL